MDDWELIEAYFNDLKKAGKVDDIKPDRWRDSPPPMQVSHLHQAWRKIQ